jgi:ABC-type transport system involved in multi-copper enzyme maturation permease subunit
MLARIGVITLNTYREAVRARVLHGLFALALGTGAYSLVVGQYALRDSLRVVGDLGSASISLYAVVVAVVLGATSLYRELELKTIFPILARPLRRSEYLVGKYLGTLFTLFVFVLANAGALLLALAELSGAHAAPALGVGLGSIVVLALVGFKWPRTRTYLPVPWAAILFVAGYWMASGAPDDRSVILGSAILTVCEVGIIAAVATLFASFSSPFLTAVFTFGVFIVGRSADTLGHLPARVFGESIKATGQLLSKVVPNLMLYVPPRPLLTGVTAQTSLGHYLTLAAIHALAWVVGLLAIASLIFRRRDFL